MFGSTSGSPYGAAGLLTSGNHSAGSGGPLGYANNAPMPSGGAPDPDTFSVYNRSLDSETLPQLTTLVHPSRHPDLVQIQENNMSTGDFLMVLRPKGAFADLRSREAQYGLKEVALLTIPAVNRLLRDQARDTLNSGHGPPGTMQFWFSKPDVVADTIRPFGVMINKMEQQTYGGGIDRARNNPMINVQVSRRVNVKNNFYIGSGKEAAVSWSTSTQQCGILYRLCSIRLADRADPQHVVQLFCVRLPAPCTGLDPSDTEITATHENNAKANPALCAQFDNGPCGRGSVVIPIGRVLNSSLTNPKVGQCVSSCIIKTDYDVLKTIEIELGCV